MTFFQQSLPRTFAHISRHSTSFAPAFVPTFRTSTSRLFSSCSPVREGPTKADEFRLGYHKKINEDVLQGAKRPSRGQGFELDVPGEGNYLLSAYCTPNNFICGLTWIKQVPTQSTGQTMSQHYVIIVETTGQCGFKKGQRGTMEAATQTSLKMVRHIKSVMRGEYPRSNLSGKKWPQPNNKPKYLKSLPPLQTLQVRWRGFGNGREALYKVLMSDEAKEIRDYIVNIGDRTPVPVGGPRPRKERKV